MRKKKDRFNIFSPSNEVNEDSEKQQLRFQNQNYFIISRQFSRWVKVPDAYPHRPICTKQLKQDVIEKWHWAVKGLLKVTIKQNVKRLYFWSLNFCAEFLGMELGRNENANVWRERRRWKWQKLGPTNL